MSNLLKFKQIYGENPSKFITTDGSSKVVATYDFTAASVPFDVDVTSMTSTDVNAAIIEVWNLASASTFANPMVTDLLFANTYKIAAQNGIGSLNLRDTANNFVTLLGGTKRLAFTTNYWGISSTATFGNSDNFIKSDSSLSVSKWNTTYNLLEMRIDGTGIGLSFDKATQDVISLYSKSDSIVGAVITTADNYNASYTTAAQDQSVLALSANGITFDVGIINSVALGGTTYNVSISDTAYVSNLAFATGANRIWFYSSISTDSDIFIPNDTGTLALRDGGQTDLSVSRWDAITNNYIDSLITDDGVGVGIGGIVSLKTFSVAAVAADESAIYAVQSGTAGYPQMAAELLVNGVATTNIGLRVSAVNATNNYAMYIDNGYIYAATTTAVSIGDGTMPNLTNQLVRLSSANSNSILNITQTGTSGTRYGSSIGVSGAATNNYGLGITVSGAATTNIGLSVSATGTLPIGVLISNGGLLVGGSAYLNTSVLAQFDSETKAIVVTRVTDPAVDIATPAAGMIAYNTTTNRHMGYNGTIWNNLY